MENDQQYAEMLNMMRAQGSKDNPTTLLLGIMQSADSVKIDDLILNKEDLYISTHLLSGYTRTLKIPYVSGATVDTTQSDPFGTVDSEGNYNDPDTKVTRQSNITYTDGLKKGDMVAVMKLNDKDTYVILDKVVSA